MTDAEMTREQAITLLQHHTFTHPDFDHIKSTTGFLGSLRPFKGTLIDANFHEVMACIRCLSAELESQAKLDKTIISPLWGLCHFARVWGVEPGGMLRSNDLISEDQVATLRDWITTISYAVTMLIDGAGIEEAFADYTPPASF